MTIFSLQRDGLAKLSKSELQIKLGSELVPRLGLLYTMAFDVTWSMLLLRSLREAFDQVPVVVLLDSPRFTALLILILR